MKTTFSFALILCLAASAHGQPKQPVHVECHVENDDWIGKRVCTALHDSVANSPRYRESEDTSEPHWNLHVVSMTEGDQNASIQGVSMTFSTSDGTELYLDTYAYLTGASVIKQQAEAIFAAFDDDVHTVANMISGKKSRSEEQQ